MIQIEIPENQIKLLREQEPHLDSLPDEALIAYVVSRYLYEQKNNRKI